MRQWQFYVCCINGPISHQGICDSHIHSTALTNAFRAVFFVHTRTTAVTPIKLTMQVIGVVMAVSVSNKSSQLALWKNLGENRLRITNESDSFCRHFLPPVMHPAIVSGMGMARKYSLGTDSSWINVEIEQFLLMQFKRWILNWTNGSPSPAPPIIACPLPSCTMACLKSPIGNFGPENKGNTISCLVRNHVKLLHVYKLRRGFFKGTVLCGGY